FVGLVYSASADLEPVTFNFTDNAGGLVDLSTTQIVSNNLNANVTATKFAITNPSDGTVDAAITVTVRALNAQDVVDTEYTSDVYLNATGSATGYGLVDISSGTGTKSLSDQITETVNLSLADTQSTGLTVTSTQNVVFDPGVLRNFTIDAISEQPVGTFNVVMRARDQYSNLKTDFTGTVNMSLSTGTFVYPTTGSSAFSSGVRNETVTVSTNAVHATNAVVITYNNGTHIMANSSNTFRIYKGLDPPTVYYPGDSTTNISTTPNLQWNSVTDASSYRIELSTSPTFATTTVNATTSGTNYTITSALTVSTWYYWHVRAIDASGKEQQFGGTWSFKVGDTSLTTSSVTNNTVTSYSAVITWTTSVSASSQVAYGTSSSSLSLTTEESDRSPRVTSHSVTINDLARKGTTYYYKVISNDANGNSVTSTVYNFTTTSFAITRPDNGDLNTYFTVNTWNSFALPLWLLQNRTVAGTLSNTNVTTTLASVAGNYTLIYWYNSTSATWLSYAPGASVNSLANFTDNTGTPNYYIYINATNERIEIA
ncbi:MAG: hypothetical protein HY832_02365, partial [Candidatus Aenigmarchaeota archaeon]|nr:hypothetical protein [Candidatus Aenigmarchaeota archaeon]